MSIKTRGVWGLHFILVTFNQLKNCVSERTLGDMQGERTLQHAGIVRAVERGHHLDQPELLTEMKQLHWDETWHMNVQLY